MNLLSIPKLLKETEFDVSRVGALLKHLNSLKEASLHQNIRILDIKISASFDGTIAIEMQSIFV